MRLAEINAHADAFATKIDTERQLWRLAFKKVLLELSKFAPGPFEDKNDVYFSKDPNNADVKMMVSTPFPGSKYVHVRFEHPDTHEEYARHRPFHQWAANPKVSDLKSKHERYENHPGMVFNTLKYRFI